MQTSIACLQADELSSFIAGELSDQRVAEVESHLSTCGTCRAALDNTVGDPIWWHDLEHALGTSSNTAANSYDEVEIAGDVVQRETDYRRLIELLGPTDDPSMMGRIGSYEIVGILGQGGMGAVFKAFDAVLNRYVAIKVLLPHLASSGAARARFRREGQAAAAVIDDNVMPIYSVAEWQGVPYLVTQYSRGATLEKRIRDQGPLELKEILRIGMQTARGLAAAHAQGLVHRDVKPSNILLDGTVERALLTDFGLARAVDDASITRTGIIAGTPQYMSPEQARGGSVDARSDLFGLGCVLYAMCTGRPPFRADSSYAILRMITDDEPRSIREINPDIPEWLCLLISRLMAKSPDDRFGNALEVAALLEQCLAHVQQPTSVPLPAALVTHAVGRRSIFNVTRKGVLAMLGTIGMTLLGLVLLQATEAPDISGQWTSDEWGTVVLEAKGSGEYEGSFNGTAKDQPTFGSRGSAGRGSSSTLPGGASGVMPGSPGTIAGTDSQPVAGTSGLPGSETGQPTLGHGGIDGRGSSSTILPGGGGVMRGSTGPRPGMGNNKGQSAEGDGSAGSGFGDTILPGGGGMMPGSSGPSPDKGKSGTLHLKWSRLERRFNGTWEKDAARCGTVSLRLVDKDIHGGFTTDEDVQLETGTPRVGDLWWKRSVVTVPDGGTPTADKYVPQPIDTEIRKNPDGKVSLNIKRQPWERVLKWLADASALSVDWQELPGDSLDLITTREYTMEEARDLINLHLLSRGFTMIVADEVMSIIKVKELNPAMVQREIQEMLAELPDHTIKNGKELAGHWKVDQRVRNRFIAVVERLPADPSRPNDRPEPGPLQMRVFIAVSITDLVRVGDLARITIDAIPKETFSGKVTAIDVVDPPRVDEGIRSSRYEAIVSFDEVPKDLVAGLTAEVEIEPTESGTDGGQTESEDASKNRKAMLDDVRAYAIQDLPLWSKDGTSQHIDLLIHYLEARVDSTKNGGDKIGSYDAGRGVLVVRGDARKHQQMVQLLKELRASSGQLADDLAKEQSLKTYSIADLPIWSKDGKKQSVDLLLSYLRSNVDPPSWESRATRAAYQPGTLSLVVQGTEEVHSGIKAALSRLKPEPLTAATVFYLRSGAADAVGEALKAEAARQKLRAIRLTFEPRLNAMTITSDADTMKAVQKIMESLDQVAHWSEYGVTPAPVTELTAKVLESIGLHLSPITNARFRGKNVFAEYSGGLDLTFVQTGGSAEKAGIHEEDIVVKLQGRLVTTLSDFDTAMQQVAEQIERKEADSLQFDVLRSGETVRINVPFPNVSSQSSSNDAVSPTESKPPLVTEKPLDRQNARSVVEAYVEAVLAGRVEQAASLAENEPGSRQRIERLGKQHSYLQHMIITSVYVNDPANPKTALATSEEVKLGRNEPDDQRNGFLALTLSMSQQGWLVTDVYYQTNESAKAELKRFHEANPNAVDVPPLNANVLPGTEAKPGDASANATVKGPTADKYVPQPIDTEIRRNPDGKVSFNIRGQPWEAVLRWLSEASALSVDWQELPDDSLNLITTREYTMQEARDLINLHLISRGFTMIVTGEVMLIVKVKELKPERFSE